ncbi:MAG: polyprenyl synthetase family protein [Tatlockia sp.]|jgi:farnesyl diphosphate synthase
MTKQIKDYIARHEVVLKKVLNDFPIPATRLHEAMTYALFPGGKRLRPILVYLTGALLGTELACCDSIAAAIELTHCYSLTHDDLPAMDDDALRRGKPSCHKAFDEATAILVGDGLQALAVELLLTELPKHLPAEKVVAVAKELLKASGPSGMISGQSLDLSELSKKDISDSELRHIHSLKTGKMILACITMVIAASNPSRQEIDALLEFATHLGLVFQMQDDYLDTYTDSLGKGRASDLANEKKTFAELYTKDALYHLINAYYQRAKDALKPLGARADALISLTDTLYQRSKN